MLQASSAMGQASPSHYSCPAIIDCTLNHESKYSFHSLSCFCLAFCHSNENDNMPVLSDLFHRIFLLIPGPYQPPLSSAGIPVSTPVHESCKILSLFLCPLQPSPFMSAHINTIALPWEHSGSSNSKLLNQLTHTMMNLPCDLWHRKYYLFSRGLCLWFSLTFKVWLKYYGPLLQNSVIIWNACISKIYMEA